MEFWSGWMSGGLQAVCWALMMVVQSAGLSDDSLVASKEVMMVYWRDDRTVSKLVEGTAGQLVLRKAV